jgi:hypothetical protein
MEEEEDADVIPLVPTFQQLPVYIFKTSNLIHVVPAPFNEENFALEHDFIKSKEETSYFKQQQIRWRYMPTGNMNKKERQTNTHIINWSDKTSSIYIGGELFDFNYQV